VSTNKNATIRYQALDRCFRNPGKNYYIDDLIEACNVALLDIDPNSSGVKRRQIYEDIKFMKDSFGFDAPIESFKDGRKAYYRYTDSNFSINSQPLNEQEAQQLKESLLTLSRFKGMPQFEWIEEIKIRLEDTFKLKGNKASYVSFEQNPYLKGLIHFTELFNAIQNKQALRIFYKGFKQKNTKSIVFHPWHLKQYNNRWFLFGFNESYKSLSNLAIDRIISITDSQANYIENRTIDFDEFFEDIVGVSIRPEEGTEKLLINISNEVWPYIESKPLHGSQKIKNKTDDIVQIELDIQINHELIALLFSYMDAIEIVEPKTLRGNFKAISEAIINKYK